MSSVCPFRKGVSTCVDVSELRHKETAGIAFSPKRQRLGIFCRVDLPASESRANSSELLLVFWDFNGFYFAPTVSKTRW